MLEANCFDKTKEFFFLQNNSNKAVKKIKVRRFIVKIIIIRLVIGYTNFEVFLILRVQQF